MESATADDTRKDARPGLPRSLPLVRVIAMPADAKVTSVKLVEIRG